VHRALIREKWEGALEREMDAATLGVVLHDDIQ
jgi:hypothetical protein